MKSFSLFPEIQIRWKKWIFSLSFSRENLWEILSKTTWKFSFLFFDVWIGNERIYFFELNNSMFFQNKFGFFEKKFQRMIFFLFFVAEFLTKFPWNWRKFFIGSSGISSSNIQPTSSSFIFISRHSASAKEEKNRKVNWPNDLV